MSTTAASAAIIFGPADFNDLLSGSVTSVTTVTDAQLNGQNDLLIEYTATRTEFESGDSWATLTMNSGLGFLDFINDSDYAALTKTTSAYYAAYPNHETFDGGASGSAAQVGFLSAGNPSHAVRITISGVSGGLSGAGRTVKFEIDELAATFSTADITLNDTVTIAAGGSLALDLRINQRASSPTQVTHNVTGLTVSQVPATGDDDTAGDRRFWRAVETASP